MVPLNKSQDAGLRIEQITPDQRFIAFQPRRRIVAEMHDSIRPGLDALLLVS